MFLPRFALYLSTYLVSALPGLKMNDFAHFKKLVSERSMVELLRLQCSRSA